MPFITEEIWQRVAPLAGIEADTIMLQPYPITDEAQIDANAIAETNWVMNFILGVRRIRGEMNIAPETAAGIAAKRFDCRPAKPG